MKPAFSVILFTVSSGAGYGLFMLAVLFDLFGLGGGLSRVPLLAAGIIALVLITVGLLASTAHLANPKNAWRSFTRFKTSWLSREGVFAVLFYPFGLLYLLGVFVGQGQTPAWAALAGVVAVILGVVTVLCTGMIYASLKTIRQWHSPLVPANYLILAFATGVLLLLAVAEGSLVRSPGVAGLAAVLVVAAGLIKAMYYYWIARSNGPTINTATGFTRARVRLLDPGHTHGTFLTHEFGYQPSATVVKTAKTLVFLLAYVLPLVLLWVAAAAGAGQGLMIAAAVSGLAGAGVERWLFFAEARHVVNLYHGHQTT